MISRRLMSTRSVLVPSLFTFFFAGSNYVAIYYLPIYFQSIDGVNPTESGVRNLPFIIALTVATVLSGASISGTGVATPLAFAGAVMATIAEWPSLHSRHRHAQRQVDRLPDLGWSLAGGSASRFPSSTHRARSPQGYILCDRHHLV